MGSESEVPTNDVNLIASEQISENVPPTNTDVVMTSSTDNGAHVVETTTKPPADSVPETAPLDPEAQAKAERRARMRAAMAATRARMEQESKEEEIRQKNAAKKKAAQEGKGDLKLELAAKTTEEQKRQEEAKIRQAGTMAGVRLPVHPTQNGSGGTPTRKPALSTQSLEKPDVTMTDSVNVTEEAANIEAESARKAEEEARKKAEEAAKIEAERVLKAEEEARRKAEEEARRKAEEARIKAEEEARIKAEEEARIKAEEEARIKAEEEARRKAEEEARIKAEEEARIKAEEEARRNSEEEARRQAEEEARKKAEEEARKKAEEEARIKAEEEARIKAEEEARIKAEEEARIKAEEEARKKAEEEARIKAEEEARIKAEEEAKAKRKAEEDAGKAEEDARTKVEEDRAKRRALMAATAERIEAEKIEAEAAAARERKRMREEKEEDRLDELMLEAEEIPIIIPCTKISAKECDMCSKPAKYVCPACARSTCSLKCAKEHKEKFSCSGERGVAFVPIKEFNDQHIRNDFNTLDQVSVKKNRAIKSVQKKHQEEGTELCPTSRAKLRKLAKSLFTGRRVRLKFAPDVFAIAKENFTRMVKQKNKSSKELSWTITWIFPHVQLTFVEKLVKESGVVKELVERFFNNTYVVPTKHLFSEVYFGAGETVNISHLQVLLEQPQEFFLELDLNHDLKNNLSGVVLREHPVIHVVLPSELLQYPKIDIRGWGGICLNDMVVPAVELQCAGFAPAASSTATPLQKETEDNIDMEEDAGSVKKVKDDEEVFNSIAKAEQAMEEGIITKDVTGTVSEIDHRGIWIDWPNMDSLQLITKDDVNTLKRVGRTGRWWENDEKDLLVDKTKPPRIQRGKIGKGGKGEFYKGKGGKCDENDNDEEYEENRKGGKGKSKGKGWDNYGKGKGKGFNNMIQDDQFGDQGYNEGKGKGEYNGRKGGKGKKGKYGSRNNDGKGSWNGNNRGKGGNFIKGRGRWQEDNVSVVPLEFN